MVDEEIMILVNAKQLSKAWFPINFTGKGIVILVKYEQTLNQYSSIEFTKGGIFILVNDEHHSKACFDKIIKFESNVTLVNEKQPLKILSPIIDCLCASSQFTDY